MFGLSIIANIRENGIFKALEECEVEYLGKCSVKEKAEKRLRKKKERVELLISKLRMQILGDN